MDNGSVKKRKINLVDLVVIVLVIAVVAFVVWRFIKTTDDLTNTGEITYTVVVEAIPVEMYDNIASRVPAQMLAGSALISGNVVGITSEPCEVTELEKSNITNSSIKSKIIPGGEYVTATFTLKATVDLESLLTEVGTQEVRTGRSHIVKTKYFEVTGTITTIDRPGD